MMAKRFLRLVLGLIALSVLSSRPAGAADGVENECCVCHDCGSLSVLCISPIADTAPAGASFDMVNCTTFCPVGCASSEVAPSSCAALGSACTPHSPAPVASHSGLASVAVALVIGGAYVVRRRHPSMRSL